ncbi:hypothetical protein LTR37_013790 [Vermiconidia calcicola]|uniref:Uncharacterized protein n=1 Tax=Vermiconidia calcicola TaxID=1690605 RepID=A0ACC3MVE5_9PEZI|nr:hypothetical protein LTR37_013790 [Vermiconidia calcicola]
MPTTATMMPTTAAMWTLNRAVRRGQLTDAGRKTEAEAIRDTLPRNHDGKWGFRIYRVNYDSDKDFARFVELLTAHANLALDEDDSGDEIRHLLSWDIQDSEAELSGASIDQVRDMFNQWIDSIRGNRGSTRYARCIYADAESINSVLTGDQPGERMLQSILHPTAFVKIIDGQWELGVEQWGPEDFDDREQMRKHNEGNEGYDPVEGCRKYEVGGMKVAACMVVTRAYQTMMDSSWHAYYVRPPAIQST